MISNFFPRREGNASLKVGLAKEEEKWLYKEERVRARYLRIFKKGSKEQLPPQITYSSDRKDKKDSDISKKIGGRKQRHVCLLFCLVLYPSCAN